VIARLQRTTVFLLVAVSLLWLVTRAWDGQWLSAIVGAFLLMNIQPLLLTVEFFVLLPWVNRGDPAPRPSLAQLLRAWWRESLTAQAVFTWHQPFRSRAHADTIGQGARGHHAIVLVHGFYCNRGLWNGWVRGLRAAQVPFIAVNLEPPFAGIDDYVPILEDAVVRATAATRMPPLLVGHSMGGLAIRAWWRAQGDRADARVHSVITIGTPHHGTFTARLAQGVNARQMRRGSAWLQELAQAEPASRRARFTCFYSHCDNISMPSSTGALAGADNRHLDGRSHLALTFVPEVFDEVMRRVKA
jgi:predicted alpha/beta hydrolase family esterase